MMPDPSIPTVKDSQRYVLGFAFQGDKVILILKQKPDWQKGKLNGVGGKVEAGENISDAMVREFKEETGVSTHPHLWARFAVLKCPSNAEVYCYATTLRDEANTTTTTDEEIYRVKTDEVTADADHLIPNVLWNIPWLVTMAKQCVRGVQTRYIITEE